MCVPEIMITPRPRRRLQALNASSRPFPEAKLQEHDFRSRTGAIQRSSAEPTLRRDSLLLRIAESDSRIPARHPQSEGVLGSSTASSHCVGMEAASIQRQEAPPKARAAGDCPLRDAAACSATMRRRWRANPCASLWRNAEEQLVLVFRRDAVAGVGNADFDGLRSKCARVETRISRQVEFSRLPRIVDEIHDQLRSNAPSARTVGDFPPEPS